MIYKFYKDPTGVHISRGNYMIATECGGWYIYKGGKPYINGNGDIMIPEWNIAFHEREIFNKVEISPEEAYTMGPTDVIDWLPLLSRNDSWTIDND